MIVLFLQPNTGDRSPAVGLAAFPNRVDRLASPIGGVSLFLGREWLIAELGAGEIMAFAVGDRIVHPGIGAGTIVGTRSEELIKGVQLYFVIKIPARRLTTFIPVAKMDQVGIRAVASRRSLSQIFNTLTDYPQSLSPDAKERQEQVEDQVRTGQANSLAQVVRDLTYHQHVAHLTETDSLLLNRGRSLLVEEIALATETEGEQVDLLMNQILATIGADNEEILSGPGEEDAVLPDHPRVEDSLRQLMGAFLERAA